MGFSFASWEFWALCNLIVVFLWPWLPRLAAPVLHLTPATLILGESVLAGPVPVWYSLGLVSLHWNLGLLSLQILSGLSKRAYFCVVFSSLLLSVALLLFSEGLFIIDPFWGVLPGTIGLDALITLDAYYIRSGAWVFSLLLSLVISKARAARAWTFAISYWGLILLMGIVYRSPFLPTSSLMGSFGERAVQANIEVHLEDPKSSPFSAEIWKEEFQFLQQELMKRLPARTEWRSMTPDRIFIYSSDDSKALWIGARRAQIGNFIQGSMHLSEIPLWHPLLAHELAHLFHGRLHAPLLSFLDPFFFEGFAEALSHPDPSLLLRTSSALLQEPREWPRFLSFFFSGNPRVNYRLAAGFSAFALQQGTFPWTLSKDPRAEIRQIPFSEEEQKWATEISTLKTLFREPRRRYCAWTQYRFRLKQELPRFKNMLRFCEGAEENYLSSLRLPPSSRADAWRALAGSLPEAQGDLLALEARWSDASEHYESCGASARCVLKARLMKFSEASSKLRNWLLSSEPREWELFQLFPEDPELQRRGLERISGWDRLRLYENLKTFDRLTEEEQIDDYRLTFYQSLTRTALALNPDGPREIATQILSTAPSHLWQSPSGQRLAARLRSLLSRAP